MTSMNSAVANLGTEFSLIQWIQQRSQACSKQAAVVMGIGDDTAILKSTGRDWLVTKDVLAEGVHFTTSDATYAQVGRKALAVNLSDIAAMAGEPTAAFVGVVLPRDLKRASIEELFEGIFELAEEWNVSIAGGDTNVWNGPLVISVTLLGLSHPKGSVLRSGALPGDQIFVTGSLGGSLVAGRHLHFEPRLKEAQQLHDQFQLHAMLDLSDGLSSDLRHILHSSGVGAVLQADQIPIHGEVDPALSSEERLQHALCDGEDFELLFTLCPQEASRLLHEKPLSIPITLIGEIRAEEGLYLQDDAGQTLLQKTGWIHT